MRQSDFIGKHISYYPELARIVGGVKASLFLSQLKFWTGKQSDPDGWIYKSHEEFEIELAMTRREQDSARDKLKELGLLEDKVRGTPPRIHYRLDLDKLDSYLAESAKSKPAPICTKAPNTDGEKRQMQMAETAKCYIEPENTPKNTTNNGNNPFSKPERRKKEPAPTTWPPDLTLSITMIQYARAAGIDPAKEFVQWKNYCQAHGKKYVDWEATWRTRIDNAPKFSRNGNGNGYHPPDNDRPTPRPMKDILREKGMLE